MPTVTLEACLAGLSVVSTPVGLSRELGPRYSPLVERVPLNPTPEAIAAAIAKVVVPNPLRCEVARELVINELSMQRMAAEFEEMVVRLIFNVPATSTVVPKAIPQARGYLTLTGSGKSR